MKIGVCSALFPTFPVAFVMHYKYAPVPCRRFGACSWVLNVDYMPAHQKIGFDSVF